MTRVDSTIQLKNRAENGLILCIIGQCPPLVLQMTASETGQLPRGDAFGVVAHCDKAIWWRVFVHMEYAATIMPAINITETETVHSCYAYCARTTVTISDCRYQPAASFRAYATGRV